jgi:cyclophilin family peptidyl-prolyl cis-trans isomerase
VVHTTSGDIHLQLFPDQAPKAVENFVGHTRRGYFDGIVFHQVIAKFVSHFLWTGKDVDEMLMYRIIYFLSPQIVQTGDPLGDGTGSESIWGDDFEDEFHLDLKHNRYTFSSLPFVLLPRPFWAIPTFDDKPYYAKVSWKCMWCIAIMSFLSFCIVMFYMVK